jgi:hypothetical protein
VATRAATMVRNIARNTTRGSRKAIASTNRDHCAHASCPAHPRGMRPPLSRSREGANRSKAGPRRRKSSRHRPLHTPLFGVALLPRAYHAPKVPHYRRANSHGRETDGRGPRRRGADVVACRRIGIGPMRGAAPCPATFRAPPRRAGRCSILCRGRPGLTLENRKRKRR